MRKIIDTIISLLLIILGIYIYYYRYPIIKYLTRTYATYNAYSSNNNYTKNTNYISFERTDDFTPENKEELINVLYTILDNGMESFTFNCDYECEEDIKNITKNDNTLSIINNYVHPYNSYNVFNITVSEYGTVYINIEKNYTDIEIEKINMKMGQIIKDVINDNMNDKEKIKAFHDYIVNHTTYDEEEANLIENNLTGNLTSHKAYDVLINGSGVCGGYTDALAIFLNYLGINNFKVSTNKHIWNVLYTDDGWKHIDMTWDDPVTKPRTNILIYDYFIISTDELLANDTTKHNFDKTLYKELN